MPPKAKKAPAATAEEQAIIDRYAPFSQLPVPGTPPEPYQDGSAKWELAQTVPEYFLRLDAGTFIWLWRMTEATALRHHLSPSTKIVVPQQLEVALKAVRAFRSAAGTIPPEEQSERPRTKVYGQVSKKAVKAAPAVKLKASLFKKG